MQQTYHIHEMKGSTQKRDQCFPKLTDGFSKIPIKILAQLVYRQADYKIYLEREMP